ncbi:MFS transporter [bacterium]|nr:MFS transporter [bacterium]
MNENNELKRFTTINFLNLALGFLGLQFAWQMRIALAEPVTSSLGASPFLYSLIWLAGPFSGMVVQPIVGVLSDNTKSRFGRRRPYLLGGALITALALWAFPNSAGISDMISKLFHVNMPAWGGLLIAAILIWVIDACINIAQGPYRSLIPDVVPKEQHANANSYISLAIGLGSVVAMIVAPLLKFLFNYQMPIDAQFLMAGIAFTLAMIWTCLTIKEKSTLNSDVNTDNNNGERQSFWQSLKEFFLLSPEVKKICLMQFFTWIGMMCLLIYITPFAIHTVYNIPDAANSVVNKALEQTAQNYALICLAVFNFVCFVVAIPLANLANKFGNKKVHIISMLSMIIAYLGLALFRHNPAMVLIFMGLSGIGWASVCALPFAMLSRYIKPGTEGSVMGIFNIFIAGPQVFVCTLVGWLINISTISGGTNHHYELTFYIGAGCLLLASLVTSKIKE